MLVELRFEDETEVRRGENHRASAAVELEISRRGEKEAPGIHPQFDRIPPELKAQHAGEPVALRHVQRLPQRDDSRVPRERRPACAARQHPPAARLAAEDFGDRFGERVHRRGLREHARDVRIFAIELVRPCRIREEEHGRVRRERIHREPREHRPAVGVRQRVIQDHEIGARGVQPVEGIAAARCDQHIAAGKMARKNIFRDVCCGLWIVNDEDFLGHAGYGTFSAQRVRGGAWKSTRQSCKEPGHPRPEAQTRGEGTPCAMRACARKRLHHF